MIGKKGADIEKMRLDLAKLTKADVHLNIVEIRKPEIDAKLVAEGIAQQLERRVSTRRAMKRAVQSAMRLGAQGIRINCGGRLGGAEIARSVWYREGRVPLHTLRAHVDYGQAAARTAYGVLQEGLDLQRRHSRARSLGGRQAGDGAAAGALTRGRGVLVCSVPNARSIASSTRAASTARRRGRRLWISAPSA